MWLHSWPCKPDKNHWVNRVNRRAKHCKYRMTPYLLIIYIWPQPHTKHQNITNSKNLSWLTWRLLFFIASSIASKSFSAGFEHHRAKRVTTCHNVSQRVTAQAWHAFVAFVAFVVFVAAIAVAFIVQYIHLRSIQVSWTLGIFGRKLEFFMVMTEVLLIVALHHTSSHFITLHHASSRFITLHHASALRTQIGEKMIKKVKRTENGVPKWGQSHKTIQDDARCQFSGALRSALRLHEDSLKTPWDSLETPDLTIQCVMLMPVQWRKWHQGVTRDELVSTFHGFTWFHWGFTSCKVAFCRFHSWRTLNILNQQLQGLQFECCSALCAYKYVGILLPNVERDFCWVHKAGRVQPHPKTMLWFKPKESKEQWLLSLQQYWSNASIFGSKCERKEELSHC